MLLLLCVRALQRLELISLAYISWQEPKRRSTVGSFDFWVDIHIHTCMLGLGWIGRLNGTRLSLLDTRAGRAVKA